MNAPDPVPQAPAPVTVGAIPWYKSKQYVLAMTIVAGGALAFFPKLNKMLSAANVSVLDFVEMIGAGITLLGGGIVWVLRQLGKIQPITLTAAAAAMHPSTLAVVQTQAAMAQAGIPTAVTLQTQIQDAAKTPLVQPLSETKT